ncbi:hypothetical protein [Streptomyces sp. AB3(2024)]|uniref:hypothetical protein n=1 Tax=Streptomyces sp. AB3(2024) TaxID=3317321 RepID=UPI0035A39B8B
MNPARQRQADALRKAASDKARRTRQAAEDGLRQVIKSGKPVTFAAVARAANVSQHYLHRQPDLADHIKHLRAAQCAGTIKIPQQPEGHDEPTTIAVLRLLLRDERAKHRDETAELLLRIRELEEKFAAAHAEIQRLGAADDSTPSPSNTDPGPGSA